MAHTNIKTGILVQAKLKKMRWLTLTIYPKPLGNQD